MEISLRIYWVFGFYHQDAKIFLKQAELVKLMIMAVIDPDLHQGTKANSTENAVGLSM